MFPASHETRPIDRLETERVAPAAWGVDVDCFVRLEHPETHEVRLLAVVPAGGTAEWTHDGSDDRLLLTFRRVGRDGSPTGMIGSAHRWTPSRLRGSMPEDVRDAADGLRFSVREDVVLAPALRTQLGEGAMVTRGYVGAWCGEEPVAEILDFALGRQYYTMRPRIEPVSSEDGEVIYLGPPQQGWGHFLTQGLARLWYALEHPEVPVLWDAKGLQPYQQQVLDLLGVRNPQRFLVEAVRWRRVVFPFPGLSIAEFMLPAHARAIGRVPCAPRVPGRRVLLTRSGLGDAVTDEERRLDDVVQRFGYEVVHPERLSVREQLDAISSADVVLGLEGSALHTPLLLRDPVETQFFALTRHRGGAGVFDHVRRAKGLRYETLNFLPSRRRGGHRSPIELDVDAVESALEATDGLTRDLEHVQDRVEQVWGGETTYEHQLRQAQVRRTPAGERIVEAHLALVERRQHDVAKILRTAI